MCLQCSKRASVGYIAFIIFYFANIFTICMQTSTQWKKKRRRMTVACRLIKRFIVELDRSSRRFVYESHIFFFDIFMGIPGKFFIQIDALL